MDADKVAELLSLSLTVPTLALCVAVVRAFGPEAVETMHQLYRGENVGTPQRLIAGVIVSFVGAFLDNSYWGAAWLSSFLDHPLRDWLFSHGVYANIPFRQASKIAAALLHLSAAGIILHPRHVIAKIALTSAAAAGFLLALRAIV